MAGEQQEPRFFVRSGDHVDGPHPASRIKAWLKEGRLSPDILVSKDGRTWQPIKAPKPD